MPGTISTCCGAPAHPCNVLQFFYTIVRVCKIQNEQKIICTLHNNCNLRCGLPAHLCNVSMFGAKNMSNPKHVNCIECGIVQRQATKM